MLSSLWQVTAKSGSKSSWALRAIRIGGGMKTDKLTKKIVGKLYENVTNQLAKKNQVG
jgi:hypothetical protein